MVPRFSSIAMVLVIASQVGCAHCRQPPCPSRCPPPAFVAPTGPSVAPPRLATSRTVPARSGRMRRIGDNFWMDTSEVTDREYLEFARAAAAPLPLHLRPLTVEVRGPTGVGPLQPLHARWTRSDGTAGEWSDPGGRPVDVATRLAKKLRSGGLEANHNPAWALLTVAGVQDLSFSPEGDFTVVKAESQGAAPVRWVSSFDAEQFAAWVTERYGDGGRYRLPTVAEWERACRESASQRASQRIIGAYDVEIEARSGSGIRGLDENVSEWCASDGPPRADEAEYRPVRGASWAVQGSEEPCSYADVAPADARYYADVGFRLVWEPR